MNTVINQNNLVDIINSCVDATNNVVSLINKLNASFSKIKPIDNIKDVEKNLTHAINGLSSLTDIITNLSNINDKDIIKLSEETFEKDKDGKIKSKGLKLNNLIVNTSTIIESIISSIDKLSSQSIDYKKMSTFRKNLTGVPEILGILITDLIRSFSDITADGKLIKSLMGSEGSTLTLDRLNNDGSTASHSVKQNGKEYGLFDIFISYVDTINKIAELKTLPLVKTWATIKINNRMLRVFMSSILKLSEHDIFSSIDVVSKKITSLMNFIDGDDIDSVSYSDLIKSLSKLNSKIAIKSLLASIKFNKTLVLFAQSILELVANESIKNISNESKLKYLDPIPSATKKIMETVSNISETVRSFWKNMIDIYVFNKLKNPFNPLLTTLDHMVSFMKQASELLKENSATDVSSGVQSVVDFLKDFNELTQDIKSSIKDIILLGALSIVLAPASVLALASIGIITGFIFCTTKMLSWISKKKIKQLRRGLKDLAQSIFMISASIFAVTLSLIIIAKAAPLISDNWLTVLAVFGGILVGIIAIGLMLMVVVKLKLFSMTIRGSLQMMTAVLTVCGSILVVAGTILFTSLIADTVISNIGPFLKMFGVAMLIMVSAVAIAMAASLVAAPVFIGLAALGLTLLGLMGVTLMIKILASKRFAVTEDHKKIITSNVTNIKAIIQDILKLLFEDGLLGNKNNKGNRGLIGTILNFVSPSLYGLYEMVMTFAFLTTTLLSVGALVLIGGLLRSIEKININPGTIQEKIKDVVDCVHYLTKTVTAPYELKPGEKGLLGSLINWLAPELGHVIDAASSMMVLGLSVVSVGALKMIANSLNTIQNISLNKDILVGHDGKGGQVKEIMDTAGAVIKAISYQDGEKKSVYKDAKKKVKNIESVVENLVKINKSLSEIYANNITYTDGKLPGAVSLISSEGFKQVITDIAKNKGLNRDTVAKSKHYKTILKNIYGNLPDFTLDDKLAKNSIDVTNKYIEFIGKIDKVNLEKLQTSVKMFEKMADFSKSINGNFEKLAESINEELMPVLEELKETLNKIPGKIDTNAASVSASISAYSSPMAGPSTSQGMTEQVNRENPGMSPEEVKRVVDTRLNEQARAQAQSLESKFDELIELLKSGMARVSLT